MNKAARRYYKDIKAMLPSKRKYEKRFLSRIKERITEINDNTSDIDYDSIVDIMGEPTEIIVQYYSDIDSGYLFKNLRTSGFIKKVASIILLLACIIFIVEIILTYDAYRRNIDSIVTREESIIYEDDNP